MTKDMSETSGVGAALYTLESLRLSGRTGGMISHIDHLTGHNPGHDRANKDRVPGTSGIQVV